MCLPCTRFRVSCHGFYQNCILLLTPKETFGLQKKKFYLANSSSHFQVAISRQSKWAQSTYSVRKWKENIPDFSLRQKSNNSEIIARYNWERRVKFQQVFFYSSNWCLHCIGPIFLLHILLSIDVEYISCSDTLNSSQANFKTLFAKSGPLSLSIHDLRERERSWETDNKICIF